MTGVAAEFIVRAVMRRALIVKGRLTGPRSVELDRPVTSAESEVEVRIRPLANDNGESITEFLRRLPPGKRSKEEIDKQVRGERDSWGDR